jgi:ubiquinone/menaquinone biosynthesis C-methylase UbiE
MIFKCCVCVVCLDQIIRCVQSAFLFLLMSNLSFYQMLLVSHGFTCFRVLKRGGRFLCLELSHVDVPLFKEIYDVYSFSVIPAVGELVAGDRQSYQYLVESIRRFPNQEKFAQMIQEAGFERVEYENLVGGVVAIHSGLKL